MAEYTTFGDFIRDKRDKANLGLREASRLLDISPSYLSRLEAGEFKPPSGPVLLRIAQAYNVDIKKVLDKAKSTQRENEVMAADTGVTPVLQAFYRLAHNQTPEMQERMFEAALDALDLDREQKEKAMAQLRATLSRLHGKDLPRRARDDDGLFAFDIAPRVLSRAHIRSRAQSVLRAVFGAEIPLPVPIETIIRRFDRDIILIVHDEIEGGRLRDGNPAVLGLSRWSRDGMRRELVIHEDLFDAETPRGRRRASFTMAHELFHCIEHLLLVQDHSPKAVLTRSVAFVSLAPDLLRQPWFERRRQARKLLTREDWREWQANQFAAELLMPVDSVTAAFEELFEATELVAEDQTVEEYADEIARMPVIDNFGELTSLVDRFDVNPQAMAIRLISLGLIVS